jgi:aspartate kinase
MIVMKFGGSSVATAEKIRKVHLIVQERLADRPVLVVSALRGVTDLLIRVAQLALSGKPDLEEVRAQHLKVIRELGLPENLLESELDELGNLIKGISLVRELTKSTLDCIMGFGERMSVKIVAAWFTAQGLPAEAVDAGAAGMVTDSEFGEARPLPEHAARLRESLSGRRAMPVITGFVGRDREGRATTLGRNGGDYSGAIVGAALEAREIQIWTDVDGVMTADPTVVPEARSIPEMSFQEAGELAYYGARVLHPATILPAMQKGIPVRVLNTNRPEHPGTLILNQARPAGGPVRAVAYKEGITLIHIVSSRMLLSYGFLARIFEVFARHRVVVDMVATSEISVSVTTDSRKPLDEARRELSGIAEVTVEAGKGIVSVVGDRIPEDPALPARVFGVVAEEGVSVRMISLGASRINVSFLVEERDLVRSVRKLHRMLLG